MVLPFLRLLFGQQELLTQIPEWHFSISSLIDQFNYVFSKVIIVYGKEDALVFLCILVVVAFLLKNLSRYFALYFTAPIRNGMVKDIRQAIYNKILKLPLSYFTNKKKGDIISRMSVDMTEIDYSILSFIEVVFRDPLSIILYIASLLYISPQLTLIVFIILPLTGLVIGRIGKSLRETSSAGQIAMGNIISLFEESLSGLRIIKAFNAESFSSKKFLEENDHYKRLMTTVSQKRDLSAPLTEFLSIMVLALIIWYGGKLVLGSNAMLSPENFIFYCVVFSQIIPPAKSFSTAYFNIQKGMASFKRILKILDAEVKIMEHDKAIEINRFNDKIEFKNVSFCYDKEYVLKNINLTIAKGKTIALVGRSGAGKSSLADLLPRFYEPAEGEIFIDGVSIKEYKLDSLRKMMGIVTQESILFNDSISNNIAFGRNVSENEIKNAAVTANADEFIRQFDKNYDYVIGNRGEKLSGGQRQRINIARAVLNNPSILILDEATSSLDTESEKYVQDAVQKLMKNRTTLVIAHRLSTIQNADEIIVIEKGEILERGSHSKLINKNGIYKKLYDLQSFA
jgi:subfamily B ATP-binding cassette protein MsbA